MTILILGGTAEAKKIAQQLHNLKVSIIYSIAGLVRTPLTDYPLISGGFTQFNGLGHYIQQHKISMLVDVTHPYAAKMSLTAQTVCTELKLPYWSFQRPTWKPSEQDNWLFFDHLDNMFIQLQSHQRIFLTIGQVNQALLKQLSHAKCILLRTAIEPIFQLPDNVVWLKAIGPFREDDENKLFMRFQPDCLVSKNSGGEATIAKLHVARRHHLPVYLLNRPKMPSSDVVLNSTSQVVEKVKQFLFDSD